MRNLSLSALLLLVACDPPPPLTDAGSGDGGVLLDTSEALDVAVDAPEAADAPLDAPADAPVDAFVPPPSVEVVVLDGETPHAGARVAFFDPEGALVTYATTDAEGRASAALERGGAVIVIPVADTGVLRTYAWMGVEPGDVLPIVRRADPPEVPDIETTVRLPDVPSTTRWQVETNCGTASAFANPVPISLRSDCARADVVASYFDATNTLLATATTLDRPLDLSAELDLTGLRPRPSVSATFTIANLPASTGIVRLNAQVMFGAVATGGFGDFGMMGPTFSASGILPDVFGGGEVTEEARVFADGGFLVVERHGARVTDIDFGSVAMPVLTGRGYAPATATVTLSLSGAGPVVPDGNYLNLSAPGPDRDIEWNVFFTGETFTPPALPIEMMDASFPEVSEPGYQVFRVATPGDTADLRQRVFTLRRVSDLLDGPGELVYTYLSSAT